MSARTGNRKPAPTSKASATKTKGQTKRTNGGQPLRTGHATQAHVQSTPTPRCGGPAGFPLHCYTQRPAPLQKAATTAHRNRHPRLPDPVMVMTPAPLDGPDVGVMEYSCGGSSRSCTRRITRRTPCSNAVHQARGDSCSGNDAQKPDKPTPPAGGTYIAPDDDAL